MHILFSNCHPNIMDTNKSNQKEKTEEIHGDMIRFSEETKFSFVIFKKLVLCIFHDIGIMLLP